MSEKQKIAYAIETLRDLLRVGEQVIYADAAERNFVYFAGYSIGRIRLILETLDLEVADV